MMRSNRCRPVMHCTELTTAAWNPPACGSVDMCATSRSRSCSTMADFPVAEVPWTTRLRHGAASGWRSVARERIWRSRQGNVCSKGVRMASSGRLKSDAMAGFFLRPPSPRLSSNWSFLRSPQSRWETRLARLELTKVRHSGKCRRVATPRRYHHHPSLNYTTSIDQDKQLMLLDRIAISILCSVVCTYIRFKRRSMVLPILKMHLFSLPSIKQACMQAPQRHSYANQNRTLIQCLAGRNGPPNTFLYQSFHSLVCSCKSSTSSLTSQTGPSAPWPD